MDAPNDQLNVTISSVDIYRIWANGKPNTYSRSNVIDEFDGAEPACHPWFRSHWVIRLAR